MKYKVGDRVRIKSRTWWEENKPYNFPENMADDCCSRIGEMIDIEEINYLPCKVSIGNRFWWVEINWIEGEVERINIHLKLMRNEI